MFDFALNGEFYQCVGENSRLTSTNNEFLFWCAFRLEYIFLLYKGTAPLGYMLQGYIPL